MLEPLADIQAGPLVMSRDNGHVHRRIEEEDRLEWVGPISDPWACPPDLRAEWEALAEWWQESGAYQEACLRTARAAFYFGIDPDRMN